MRDEWFYARRGPAGDTRQGPVPLQELRDLMDSGQVRGDDLVWREGMAGWQRADRCDALNPPAPAPPGPRGQPRDDWPDRGRAFDDQFGSRPNVRRRSSGTVVALIVGGVVLAVGLLACGGGFLYWMLNRGSAAAKSAAVSPYVTPEGLGDSLSFGLGDLYFTSNVTRSDAQIVGDYLYKTGYFSSDHAALVQLDRDDDGTLVLRCCVQSTRIWDANVAKGFQDLRAYIADHLLYQPMEIELCDEEMQTQRTFTASDSFGGGSSRGRK